MESVYTSMPKSKHPEQRAVEEEVEEEDEEEDPIVVPAEGTVQYKLQVVMDDETGEQQLYVDTQIRESDFDIVARDDLYEDVQKITSQLVIQIQSSCEGSTPVERTLDIYFYDAGQTKEDRYWVHGFKGIGRLHHHVDHKKRQSTLRMTFRVDDDHGHGEDVVLHNCPASIVNWLQEFFHLTL